jgi:hypothetical protein
MMLATMFVWRITRGNEVPYSKTPSVAHSRIVAFQC